MRGFFVRWTLRALRLLWLELRIRLAMAMNHEAWLRTLRIEIDSWLEEAKTEWWQRHQTRSVARRPGPGAPGRRVG